MKALIFGIGKRYQYFKKYIDFSKVIAFVDNDEEKQGAFLDGIEVLNLEDGLKENFDKIYIFSRFALEMKKDLQRKKIDTSRIVIVENEKDLYGINLIKNMNIFITSCKLNEFFCGIGRKNILLISHNMSLTGAPIALLHVANILRKNGYNVMVASVYDGPLVKEFLKKNIPVIIDPNLGSMRRNDLEWIKNFSAIFVNTITFSFFLTDGYNDIPIFWWLHEADREYTAEVCDNILNIDNPNMAVYGVGPLVVDRYNKLLNQKVAKNFLYGIPDTCRTYQREKRGNLVFAIIGSFINRKGQDIFIKAIDLLSNKVKNSVEFWLVGENDSPFGDEVKLMVKGKPYIKILGELSRSEMETMYEEISVVVCPSREDPMPIVATEAMMNKKMCIVSDKTGTSNLISDKKDGLIFRAEDVEELSKKIEWAIRHPDLIDEMGCRARDIYERYFSIDIFEKNLLKVFKGKFCP